MDILSEAAALLQENGYLTRDLRERNSILFEDAAVLGFAETHSSVGEIVESWRASELHFLSTYASAFRGTEKAWNIYSIFLTEASPSARELGRLRIVEEDFVSTRKIARAKILGLQDIVTALAPLLPVQDLITLDAISFEGRLLSNLSAAMPRELALELISDRPISAESLRLRLAGEK